MRKLLSATVLASFLLTTPVSGATVSAPVAVAEPDFGFIRGMNIEWNTRHIDLLPTEEHVAYHAQIQAELEAVFAEYNGDVPMDILRAWMRQKAMEHRMWHMTQAPVEGGVIMEPVMIRLRNGEEVQAPPSRRFLRTHVRRVYQQARSERPASTETAMERETMTFMSTGTSMRPVVERISRRTLIEQYKAMVQARVAAKIAQ